MKKIAIKGCARRVVVLNRVGDGMFETAYFILKSGVDEPSDGDMLREANRIIEEHSFSPTRTARKKSVFAFVYGVLAGGGVIGLLWLLLSLAK